MNSLLLKVYQAPFDFIPSAPDTNSPNHIEEKDVGTFFGGVGESLDSYAPTMGILFTAILTLMFIVGVIRLGYAMTTKTGMVLKGSTGMLICIPLLVVVVRLFFIFFFTTSSPDVTLLINDMITFLIYVGYYTALAMVLIGLFMRFLYKLLYHPKYGRWSWGLLQGAAFLVILSAIMPLVIQSI